MTTTALARLRPDHARGPDETPYARYLAASVGLMLIASANGALRELTYGKQMSDDAAHVVSFVPMVALFTVYVNALERRWPLPTWRGALGIGAGWAAIAAGFELGLGHFVEDTPWSELFHDYNLAAGRVEALVLVSAAALPSAVRLARARRGDN